jgi:hypothetical protein
MKTLLTFLVLLLITVEVYSQSQPVIYSELTRSISVSTSFLTNERLPACDSVQYLVNNLAVAEGELLTILYIPRSDNATPAPSESVTIELLRVNSNTKTPVVISSVISQDYNGTTYLSTNECAIENSGQTLVRSPNSGANQGCGINYYCSGFSNSSSDKLYIQITTASNENSEGILYDLSIQKSSVPITSLTLGTKKTISTLIPQGNFLFKPTVSQSHYKVSVGPASNSITDYANFLAQTSNNSTLYFSLTNLQVNGVATTIDQGEWSLTINFGDIAQADQEFLISTDPQVPCQIATNSTSDFFNNSTLSITLPGCSVNTGIYYIVVGSPQNYTATYTYDLLVQFLPIDNSYIPTYKTLNNGVSINDVLGAYTYDDVAAQNIYLLNISPSNFPAGSYFFVTVFGIDYGSVSVEVTQGCFGYNAGCGLCETIVSCNPFDYGNSQNDGQDYCKVKVNPCDADTTLPYFVTVRAVSEYYSEGNDLYTVDYSIQLDIKTTNAIDVTTLPSTIGNGYIDYTYIGSVNEQDYTHFKYSFNINNITQFYHLTAHLYTNQEEDEVIFAHNVDSLAGSAPFGFDGYSGLGTFDSCYEYDYACNTISKFVSDQKPNPYQPTGSCSVVLPYCELASGTTQYFSVYAVDNSPSSYWGQMYNYLGIYGVGYNRAVDFTVVWRLWTVAEPLASNEVVNGLVIQNNQFFESSLEDNWYSHQYVYTVPTAPTGSYYDSLRVVIGDVTETSNEIYAFVACGKAAGDCPCYENDYYCFPSTDQYNYNFGGPRTCDIYVPICECEGPIYISVQSFAQNFGQSSTPATFTIAVFPQEAQVIQSFNVTTTPTIINHKLEPNSNFEPLLFSGTTDSLRFFFLYVLGTDSYFDNREVYFYDSNLFVLPITSVTPNTALQFTLRFVQTPGKFGADQVAFLSIGNGVIPSSSPFAANCDLYNCVAVPNENDKLGGYSYCSVIIDPCSLSIGTYYIRTYGATSIEMNNDAFNLEFQGISYTLTVQLLNYAPTSLLFATPIHDSLLESQYKHYSLAIPNIAQGYMRIVLYRNADQFSGLALYLNTNGLAGDTPCYSYTEQCTLLDGTTRSVCEFFISMCEFKILSGQTINLSVRNINIYNSTFLGQYYYEEHFPSVLSHVPGGIPVEYTLTAQFFTPLILDPNNPVTITSNVYKQQIDYYEFTISQADINAGKILHVEVDSIEPQLYYNASAQLKTVISTTPPQNEIPGDCPCSDNIYINNFKTTSFPCDLQGNAGTYYISVKGLISGQKAPFDPTSYTIKVYYTIPILQTLTLNGPFVSPPHPLNYNEWAIYTIPFPSQANTVLTIEIADVTNTFKSLYAYGITAYLNFGVPGSPSNENSLFGTASSCSLDSCEITNTESTPVPANTVMCNFVISGCTQCTGNYYVTIKADLLEPEPRIQYRSNFTIRAYTQVINTLESFPTNISNGNGGITFTIDNSVNPAISCETRFSSKPVFTNFFFKLPPITVAQYEVLYMNNSNNNNNIYIAYSSDIPVGDDGSDCSCPTSPGEFCQLTSGCTVGSDTVTVYGLVGYDDCEDGYQSGFANGIEIGTYLDASLVYTQLQTINVASNTLYNQTLAAGQFVVLVYNSSLINNNLLPEITFNLDLSQSNGNSLSRTCLSDSPVLFPGSVIAGDSFCSLCTASTFSSTQLIDGCCLDHDTVLYLTVYNPFNNSPYTFTFEVTVDYQAISYQQLTLPIVTTVNSIASDLPYTFSFNVPAEQIGELNMRFTSSNGVAAVYLNFEYLSHPTNPCADFVFSCLTGESDGNCVIQLPQCYLATFTGLPYATLFVAIQPNSENSTVGPVSININYQVVSVVPFPTTSPVSGIVPDVSGVPVNYLVNYKFEFTRTVGDTLLDSNNAAIVVELTPSSTATNNLLLSIHDPRFSSSNNELAGPPLPLSHPAQEDCDYNHDSVWQCYASNNIGGFETQTTSLATGVSCYLYFCDDGDAQSYADQLISGSQYVYFSVQNTDTTLNRVPTNYQVSVSVVSNALSSSQVLYQLTPSHSTVDSIFSSICTSTAATGGCTFSGNSSITTAYFNVNLANIASWGINDYLSINITGLNTNVKLNYWTNDQCEPSLEDSIFNVNNDPNLFFAFDPCEFTSLFRADNGANKYVVQPRNLYIRVDGLTQGSTFNLVALQTTPLQTTIVMKDGATYSETFQSWEGRWAMFNFVLPKDELYDFDIEIDANCDGAAPKIYRNEYAYQWASEACSEVSDDTPFTDTHYSCETGGNYFISVYTPPGSLLFPPIFTSNGNVSSQIEFTITATLTPVVQNLDDYTWESTFEFTEAGLYNLIALGDNENFGTGINIVLSGSNSDSLTVISPLYRSGVNNTLWNETFFALNEESPCAVPDCEDEGVYCCSESCTINIPPCEYRNGRYFIIVNVNSVATLTSRIYRKDYVNLEISDATSYLATSSGALAVGPISGSNFDLEYYQYYKIVVSGDPFFLHVEVSSNAVDLFESISYQNNEKYAHYYNYDENFPILRASLRRGDNGISTASDCDGYCTDCQTAFCETSLPGTCVFGEDECTDSVYYLAIWFNNNNGDLLSSCASTVDFQLRVTGRNDDPITISPNVVVCGTLEGALVNYTDPSFTEPGDFYPYSGGIGSRSVHKLPQATLSVEDPVGLYPYSNTYQVDLTGIDTNTADFVIVVVGLSSYQEEDIILSVSTSGPASPVCNDCASITDIESFNNVASVYLTCGAFTELWVTVTTADLINVSFDYFVYVDTIEYTPSTPVIPSSLEYGFFSPDINVTVTTPFNVVPISIPNHQFAIVATGENYITGESVYNSDCSNGCPLAEDGCLFLGASPNYYLYYVNTDIGSKDFDCFETPVTKDTISFSVQPVHTLLLPSPGSINSFTSYVPSGGYDLAYIPLNTANQFNTLSIDLFFESAIETNMRVNISCNGFTAGDTCATTILDSFTAYDSSDVFTLTEEILCNCPALYLTFVQESSCGAGTHFTFGVTVEPVEFFFPIVALTNNVRIADSIPSFALTADNSFKIYSFTSGTDGFIHGQISNVNNTNGPNFHSARIAILDDLCLLEVSNTFAVSQDTPPRDSNSQISSGYVYVNTGVPNTNYYFYVFNDEVPDPSAAAVTYDIIAVNSYTDLESTANQHFQIQGYNRHYYKVNGRKNALSTNDIQSVVITMTLIDGDRLEMIVSDDPLYINYVDNSTTEDFTGWKIQKLCYFGVCTIEIPTRAQHPGATVFFVWVVTVDTSPPERLEKPSNYLISATTALNNCDASFNSAAGFCSSTVRSYSNPVYLYRDANQRNLEAEARYESLLCRCAAPLSQCRSNLLRFSCLESFRECDASGFWLPLCRGECETLVSNCGSWSNVDQECDCARPEFSCANPRYSDLTGGFCTGNQITAVVSPSSSPVVLPSAISGTLSGSPSQVPTSSFVSISLSPSTSPSPFFTPPVSVVVSPPLSPSHEAEVTVIIYYFEVNTTLQLLPNTFILLLLVLFFNLY